MGLKKMLVLGVFSGALVACSSTSTDTGMRQVSFDSKEHAINTPLSAAILRRVKDVPAPEAVKKPDAGEASKAVASAPVVDRAPVTGAPAAGAVAAAPAAAASGVNGAASAPAPAVAVPVVAEAPPVERWTVEVSDGALSRALKRWAVRANVPLVWEAPKDKPALYAVYTGTFEEAVTKVMRDTRQSEYRVHACAHDNVVRILHASQPCKRN